MIIGPITIRWTKDIQAEAQEAQRLDMRRNSVIYALTHDKQHLAITVAAQARRLELLEYTISKLKQMQHRQGDKAMAAQAKGGCKS